MMTRTMCTHPDTAKAEVGISLSSFFSSMSQFKDWHGGVRVHEIVL